jgi:hypothetical protein
MLYYNIHMTTQHSHHDHAHAPAPGTVPAATLRSLSFGQRLIGALALIAALWTAVFWVLG